MNRSRHALPATAFVDWNSQIHFAKPPRSLGPVDQARATLEVVGKTIGKILNDLSPASRFDVQMRLYHGWHKGFERTVNRKAITAAVAGCDFISLSRSSNVFIRPDISYGDLLISGLDSRTHTPLGIHLPGTLRDANTANGLEEKLVDTSLSVDVVDLAHREPWRWLLVLAEDDDLIAPVIAAEAILSGATGRVVLVRDRSTAPFYKLNDLRRPR